MMIARGLAYHPVLKTSTSARRMALSAPCALPAFHVQPKLRLLSSDTAQSVVKKSATSEFVRPAQMPNHYVVEIVLRACISFRKNAMFMPVGGIVTDYMDVLMTWGGVLAIVWFLVFYPTDRLRRFARDILS